MPSSRLFILDNMIRNKQGSKFVKPAVMQQTLAILFATLKTYYNQQANRLGHHNLQKKKWGNHHKFLLQAKIPLGARRLGFNKIFSQSVSLTQYVVLFVCLSFRLFQLASDSSRDIAARRCSAYCPRGAIFISDESDIYPPKGFFRQN